MSTGRCERCGSIPSPGHMCVVTVRDVNAMLLRPVQYSARIDAIVYAVPPGMTRDEWLALAMAALDQAQVSAHLQEDIKHMLANESLRREIGR